MHQIKIEELPRSNCFILLLKWMVNRSDMLLPVLSFLATYRRLHTVSISLHLFYCTSPPKSLLDCSLKPIFPSSHPTQPKDQSGPCVPQPALSPAQLPEEAECLTVPKYKRDLVQKLKILRQELSQQQPQAGHCRIEVCREEIFEVKTTAHLNRGWNVYTVNWGNLKGNACLIVEGQHMCLNGCKCRILFKGCVEYGFIEFTIWLSQQKKASHADMQTEHENNSRMPTNQDLCILQAFFHPIYDVRQKRARGSTEPPLITTLFSREKQNRKAFKTAQKKNLTFVPPTQPLFFLLFQSFVLPKRGILSEWFQQLRRWGRGGGWEERS